MDMRPCKLLIQVSVAMGCAARERNLVFASTLASFFTRAYDQLRIAAISDSSINLCGSHCGLSTGQWDAAGELCTALCRPLLSLSSTPSHVFSKFTFLSLSYLFFHSIPQEINVWSACICNPFVPSNPGLALTSPLWLYSWYSVPLCSPFLCPLEAVSREPAQVEHCMCT